MTNLGDNSPPVSCNYSLMTHILCRQMLKRKAEDNSSDSDSDQSIPEIFSSHEEKRFEICMDNTLFQIDEAVIGLSDEEKCTKFVQLCNSAKSGVEINDALKTLMNSGQKFGMSLTMNRIIKCLGVLMLITPEESKIKWGKESKNPKVKVFKDRIEKCLVDMESDSEIWKKIMTDMI